jgi:dTDP-4-amino-4,6-dideoxygalactose transaminase
VELAAVQPRESAGDVTGVRYVDFPAQYEDEREAITSIVDGVFSRGDFVGGKAVADLEAALADRCGTAFAVALGSGTDALILALIAAGLKPGDEVITPPNSFVASTSAIIHAGGVPVFADVGPDQAMDPGKIEAAITPRTRAILPVHLTGRIADMDAINDIAERYGLFVIEDAAQSIGSLFHGKPSGSLGTLGCFSTHPLKNLGGAGDGGFVTTDDAEIAKTLINLRNHGLEGRYTVNLWGFVSRMDTLQAAILLHRLTRLDDVIAARRANAERYRDLLDGTNVFVPPQRPDTLDTFHTFVIQVDERDELQASLFSQGIETLVHYPVPLHLQPAANDLGYGPGDFPATEAQAARILSLPIHQYLTAAQIEYTANAINAFFSA